LFCLPWVEAEASLRTEGGYYTKGSFHTEGSATQREKSLEGNLNEILGKLLRFLDSSLMQKRLGRENMSLRSGPFLRHLPACGQEKGFGLNEARKEEI